MTFSMLQHIIVSNEPALLLLLLNLSVRKQDELQCNNKENYRNYLA